MKLVEKMRKNGKKNMGIKNKEPQGNKNDKENLASSLNLSKEELQEVSKYSESIQEILSPENINLLLMHLKRTMINITKENLEKFKYDIQFYTEKIDQTMEEGEIAINDIKKIESGIESLETYLDSFEGVLLNLNKYTKYDEHVSNIQKYVGKIREVAIQIKDMNKGEERKLGKLIRNLNRLKFDSEKGENMLNYVKSCFSKINGHFIEKNHIVLIITNLLLSNNTISNQTIKRTFEIGSVSLTTMEDQVWISGDVTSAKNNITRIVKELKDNAVDIPQGTVDLILSNTTVAINAMDNEGLADIALKNYLEKISKNKK